MRPRRVYIDAHFWIVYPKPKSQYTPQFPYGFRVHVRSKSVRLYTPSAVASSIKLSPSENKVRRLTRDLEDSIRRTVQLTRAA